MTLSSSPTPQPPGRSNLALRIGAAAVLIPLTLLAAWMGGWVWLAVVTLVAIGLYVEWLDLVGARTPMTLAAGLVALLVVATAFGLGRIAATWVLIALTLAVLALLLSPKRGWVLMGSFYALAALAASVLLRGSAQESHSEGFAAILFVLLLVWMTDTGGYVAGRSIGGPKLAPTISPNKTWAGALGGFAGALMVAAIFAMAGQGRVLPLLAVAAALSVASQAGDLFESAVKRRFGVKDSGNLIPGHGGLLDRLDGFVAAVTLAAIIGLLRGGGDGASRGLMVW